MLGYIEGIRWIGRVKMTRVFSIGGLKNMKKCNAFCGLLPRNPAENPMFRISLLAGMQKKVSNRGITKRKSSNLCQVQSFLVS